MIHNQKKQDIHKVEVGQSNLLNSYSKEWRIRWSLLTSYIHICVSIDYYNM